MFKLEADCDNCAHRKVCSFVYNAKNDIEKLKNTQYGKNPNTDYNWDVMAKHRNVDITFSCPDFQVNIVEKGVNIKLLSDD